MATQNYRSTGLQRPRIAGLPDHMHHACRSLESWLLSRSQTATSRGFTVGLDTEFNGLRRWVQILFYGVRRHGKRMQSMASRPLRLLSGISGILALIMVIGTGAVQTAHAAPPEWAKGRILVAPKAGLSVRMSDEWGRTNPPRCFQTTNYRNSAITGA